MSMNNMNISDNNTDKDNDTSVCANCGKEGDDLKSCMACKMVKYCNRECQIAHRPQHKKECRRRAAELHDEKLFKEPPSLHGDCPICLIQLPTFKSGRSYQSCCGKVICSGCYYAPVYDNQGNKVGEKKCPYCRTLAATSEEEAIERFKKRVDAGDAVAIYNVGGFYRDGLCGFPQDYRKALELHHRNELGIRSYNHIGIAYELGQGVEVDMEKANYYYKLAAMRGDVEARHNLGNNEEKAGNMDRALKHYMIAIRGGHSNSLNRIKLLYSEGHATKEGYSAALRSYQVYLDEIKSPQRDKAAAADEVYHYY